MEGDPAILVSQKQINAFSPQKLLAMSMDSPDSML